MTNNPLLPINRNVVGMMLMVVLVSMGEKLADRFLPLYLIALGGGALAVGLLSGAQNLIGAIYSYPGGYLSDRLGYKRALTIFNLMSLIGYIIAILIPTWQAALVGAMLFLSWSAISMPAMMSLVTESLPASQRTMGVTMHSLIKRLPMAVGPLFGGWIIATWGETDGIRYAFIFAATLTLAAIIVENKLVRGSKKAPNAGSLLPITLFKRMSHPLRQLLVSDILIRFCEQIPNAFVVIWCMKTIAEPVTSVEFGVLTAIEMVTAVLIYIPVARAADKTTKRPFVIMTFIFFAIFPAVLYVSQTFWILVVAFVIRGLKEFGEPARKALILDLCPDDARAATFGLYYFIRDTIVSIAAFGGALLWMHSPELTFGVAFGFGIFGTFWFILSSGSPPLRGEAQN
jgi:MFS family permease